jgi:hypothetical protein
MVEIIWQLPGTAEFRRNCAQVCVRYLGGDLSLVDEITANRAAQQRLAWEDPSHPARLFGEAVESEGARQLRQRNEELQLELSARQILMDAGLLEDVRLALQRPHLQPDARRSGTADDGDHSRGPVPGRPPARGPGSTVEVQVRLHRRPNEAAG